MAALGETLARLRALQNLPFLFLPGAGRLSRLWAFGTNPGNLRGWRYVPHPLPSQAPLVVVLHGCRQDAAGYDSGSGWSALADEAGFALLYPEQTLANNLFRCFNWFEPLDVAERGGELQSIHQMIAAMVRHHRLDPHRIYITGLSAGGAMTAAMVARFPELFSGASIIAGVPFGIAATPAEAFARMAGNGLPDAAALAGILRRAAPDAKTYPSLSLWQGEADDVVVPANSEAIAAQFRGVLDVPVAPHAIEQVGPAKRKVWRDSRGHVRLEQYLLPGMGHGTPIAPGEGCGTAAPYMIDAGICSTRRIAHQWGIAALEAPAPERKAAPRRGLLRRLADMVLRRNHHRR